VPALKIRAHVENLWRPKQPRPHFPAIHPDFIQKTSASQSFRAALTMHLCSDWITFGIADRGTWLLWRLAKSQKYRTPPKAQCDKPAIT